MSALVLSFPCMCEEKRILPRNEGIKAAAEFQKILDHRGIVVNAPIGALAYLGIARAYALQNDTPKARAAYHDFLNLWKNADPDIPILKKLKLSPRGCNSLGQQYWQSEGYLKMSIFDAPDFLDVHATHLQATYPNCSEYISELLTKYKKTLKDGLLDIGGTPEEVIASFEKDVRKRWLRTSVVPTNRPRKIPRK